MRARDLLKWKRALNEIRFKHEELEIVKEICSEQNAKFSAELHEFCKKNGIDIGDLIRKKEALRPEIEPGNSPENLIGEPDEPTDLSLSVGRYLGEVPEIKKENSDEDEMYKIFKSLFKKIALHLHPDRLQHLTEDERSVRLSMFKEAHSALDERNYFKLLDLSERFNIKMPKNFKQQTRWMKGRIRELEQEIQKEKSSYNYAIAEADTQEQKDSFYRSFIKQVFGI